MQFQENAARPCRSHQQTGAAERTSICQAFRSTRCIGTPALSRSKDSTSRRAVQAGGAERPLKSGSFRNSRVAAQKRKPMPNPAPVRLTRGTNCVQRAAPSVSSFAVIPGHCFVSLSIETLALGEALLRNNPISEGDHHGRTIGTETTLRQKRTKTIFQKNFMVNIDSFEN
jgi:hypothetical protein